MQIRPQLMSLFGLNIQGDIGGITCYRSARQRFTWFAATTPKIQASTPQQQQRLRWTRCAAIWQALDATQKLKWMDAARLAHLSISGYNLFMHCQTRADLELLATIDHQTGIHLTI